MIDIANKEQLTQMISETPLMVVDFYSPSCAPCKVLEPILKVVEEEAGVPIVKVDVSQNQDIVTEFGIRSVPTLMIFKGGELEYTKTGVVTKEALLSMLDV